MHLSKEWAQAMKITLTGLAGIGGIVGMFIGVEAWTDEKIETAVTASELRIIEKQAMVQAGNDINHDKIIQRQRLSEAMTNIRIAELQLAQVEDEIEHLREQGRQPTERLTRAHDRLVDSLKIWEAQASDAQRKLAAPLVDDE